MDDDDLSDAGDPPGVGDFLRQIARAEPRNPGGSMAYGPTTPGGLASETGSARSDLVAGEVIDGKYRIEAPLGRGGMGSVYEATHLGTGRAVALKVLAPELTANEAAIERFRREARAAGQLRHPNVVDVTDFGFGERQGVRLAYLGMELLRGKTLRAVLDEERRLPLDVAIDVLAQVCGAIAEAHRLGILHRDLKPENIHLEPIGRGRYLAKVLDFGIAKLVYEASTMPAGDADEARLQTRVSTSAATTPSSLTRLGAAIGTPRYMSPEQWRGSANDVRTDIYSLGVIAFEMLSGEAPFSGKERFIGLEHAELPAPSLADKAPAVPRPIATVVGAALAKDPAARPPSAAAFVAALHARTETTAGLIRRSLGLCVDHYALVSRRCVLLWLPPVIIAAVSVGDALLVHAGVLSRQADKSIEGVIQMAMLLSIFLWVPVTGKLVPLVVDLLAGRAAPRPPSRDPVVRIVARSFPSMALALVVLTLGMVLVVALTDRVASLVGSKDHLAYVREPLMQVVGALIVAPFIACGAVVVVEQAGGVRPLRRSATLLRPMLRMSFGVTLFYNLLTVGLPALAMTLLGTTGALKDASAIDTTRLRELFAWIVTAGLAPFALVPIALLYLRAREAEGAPVESPSDP
jgi:serine/threonine protein kinase